MTQNNNSSMATVVETFIVEETSELIHDNEQLDKWNAMVADLGLQGQESVRVVGKSPIPFLWMNSAIIATFEVLCPTRKVIEKYDKTPIPVEILDLVTLSKRDQYFDKVEIWYNDKNPDPACIGYAYDQSQDSSWAKEAYAKKYLIGRWADVKASLDTLVKNAKELFIKEQATYCKTTIKSYQRQLEDIEDIANQKFGEAMPTTVLPF